MPCLLHIFSLLSFDVSLTPRSAFGGRVFWSVYFGLILAFQIITAFQTYWLGRWARAYSTVDDWRDVRVSYYLGLYVAYVLISLASLGASAAIYFLGAIKASRVIHRKLINHIFGAHMWFLDSTPVGRIISRFTKDMKAIDGSVVEVSYACQVAPRPLRLADVLGCRGLVLWPPRPLRHRGHASTRLCHPCHCELALLSSVVIDVQVIGIMGALLGELYMHAQLSVKREQSNAKSPLFSYLSAAVQGVVSIRAYGAQAYVLVPCTENVAEMGQQGHGRSKEEGGQAHSGGTHCECIPASSWISADASAVVRETYPAGRTH